uniref:Uncharacterized protein LOC101496808 n=1 Tax=Cicer arietinum TaxID=3827 RepID=A0A1S2XFM7_CICAR|nr:uncharacterized protein LOC101496808 [Cicer arietinum]
MSSSIQENVFELENIDQFWEANNVILTSLMEETQDEFEDEYYGDDKLVSMIQSLEAEISSPEIYGMGQMDGQDCSTSFIGLDHWIDENMELISSSPFDEVNASIPCEDEMTEYFELMEYEAENFIDGFEMCYGVFLEQQHTDTCN